MRGRLNGAEERNMGDVGGRTDDVGLTLSFNNNKMLGFSLTGNPIPPQPTAAPLVELTLSATEAGTSVCLEGVVRFGMDKEMRDERAVDDGEICYCRGAG